MPRKIVEITFLEDTQNVQTDNALYVVGTTPHFWSNQTDALIAAGHAVLGDKLPVEIPESPRNLASLKLGELREMAKDLDISGHSSMNKATLLAQIADHQTA